MKIRPNRRYAELVARLSRSSLHAKAWTGVTFRSVLLDFAKPDEIVSGKGSRLYGGRWNAPGFAVTYSSTRPATAIEEAYQLAADFNLAPEQIRPRITCGIHWNLARVLDLTADRLPSWLRISAWLKEDFARINDSGNETLCQAFGRAVRNSGISGMFCPSARAADGVNLVVFLDRLRKGESLRVLGEKELKAHLA